VADVQAHHGSRGSRYRGRELTVKAPKKLPRVLTVAETQAVMDSAPGCGSRFFFALMHETDVRRARILGPRHEDIAAAGRDKRHAAGERDTAHAPKSARIGPVPVGTEADPA